MALSSTTTAILQKAALKTELKGDPRKAVLVRFEEDFYNEVMTKKRQMEAEANANGDLSTISIQSVITAALKVFIRG
jgi:hypothetical protein